MAPIQKKPIVRWSRQIDKEGKPSAFTYWFDGDHVAFIKDLAECTGEQPTGPQSGPMGFSFLVFMHSSRSGEVTECLKKKGYDVQQSGPQ